MLRVRRQVQPAPANLVPESVEVTFAASCRRIERIALGVTRNEMEWFSRCRKFTLVRASNNTCGRIGWFWRALSRSRSRCSSREFSYAPMLGGEAFSRNFIPFQSRRGRFCVLVFKGVKNNTKRPSCLLIAQCSTRDFACSWKMGRSILSLHF